jgi:hypothetical protein
MGAASDHVVINLTIQSTGLARQGYGVPLILSHEATFTARVRYYSSIAAVAADFSTTGPTWRAANVIFAQVPHPARIAVGRATGTVTQAYDIALVQAQAGALYSIEVKGKGITDTTVSYSPGADLAFASTDVNTGADVITKTAHGMPTGAGPFRFATTGALPTGTGIAVDTNVWIIAPTADTYKLATSKANALAGTAIDITAAGSGSSTLIRARNDTIIAQLVQGIAAVPGFATNFAVTQVPGAAETDTLHVVATTPNAWCSLATFDPDLMTNTQSHAAPSDVTLATDLAAIRKADQGWYSLLTYFNSSSYVQACETFTEANGITYAWDSPDAAIVTTAQNVGTDVGALSLASGFAASMGGYHPSPADFMMAGELGRWLPTLPGRATPKFKTLALVRPVTLTDTHKANLRARRMNSYEQVVTDRAFFWEGTVFSQIFKFFDVRRNSDWLSDNVQKAILGVFVGSDIVPETPAGVSKLAGSLRGVGDLGETQGVLRAGWTVQAPVFDDIPDVELGNRNLPGLTLAGALAGAIHTAIPVDINLTF